ncbi:MAG: hypothetical protein QG608_3322 [Actinomycetota bacterium]|nr:hypothetical protein [Actinomycetota bacterium]
MTARSALRCASNVAWGCVATLAWRGVSGSLASERSRHWLSTPTIGCSNDSLTVRFVIIMPLLREQNRVGAMCDHFTQIMAGYPGSVLLLVTTAREEAEDGGGNHKIVPESTAAIAERLAEHCQQQRIDVRHVHFPQSEGAMAHQVNYAVDQFLKEIPADQRQKWWVGLYNADSRPDPDALNKVSQAAAEDGCVIVQQSALFTANITSMPRSFSGLIASGAAVLQSRWTLAREIPRLRAQWQATQRGERVPLAHCVGHGLFARADYFARSGGLPLETMNEDLAFGYFACAEGTPIRPVAVLECGDAPRSVSAFVGQTRQWFWSYAQYPAMAALAAQRGLGTPADRARLTTAGLIRGALWLGQSPVAFGALALPVLHAAAGGSRRGTAAAVGASALALGTYCSPAVGLARHLPDRSAQQRALIGLLPALLVSSVGPWLCVADAVRAGLTGLIPAHAKTED